MCKPDTYTCSNSQCAAVAPADGEGEYPTLALCLSGIDGGAPPCAPAATQFTCADPATDACKIYEPDEPGPVFDTQELCNTGCGAQAVRYKCEDPFNGICKETIGDLESPYTTEALCKGACTMDTYSCNGSGDCVLAQGTDGKYSDINCTGACESFNCAEDGSCEQVIGDGVDPPAKYTGVGAESDCLKDPTCKAAATMHACVGTSCQVSSSGGYEDSNCDGDCVSYNCGPSGNCVEVPGDGIDPPAKYTGPNAQLDCLSGPDKCEPPVASYVCLGPTGVPPYSCASTYDYEGEPVTLGDCNTGCVAPKPDVTFSCIAGTQCIDPNDGSGHYTGDTAYTDCDAQCPIKYSCVNEQCEEDASSALDLKGCQAICGGPPIEDGYTCSRPVHHSTGEPARWSAARCLQPIL